MCMMMIIIPTWEQADEPNQPSPDSSRSRPYCYWCHQAPLHHGNQCRPCNLCHFSPHAPAVHLLSRTNFFHWKFGIELPRWCNGRWPSNGLKKKISRFLSSILWSHLYAFFRIWFIADFIAPQCIKSFEKYYNRNMKKNDSYSRDREHDVETESRCNFKRKEIFIILGNALWYDMKYEMHPV